MRAALDRDRHRRLNCRSKKRVPEQTTSCGQMDSFCCHNATRETGSASRPWNRACRTPANRSVGNPGVSRLSSSRAPGPLVYQPSRLRTCEGGFRSTRTPRSTRSGRRWSPSLGTPAQQTKPPCDHDARIAPRATAAAASADPTVPPPAPSSRSEHDRVALRNQRPPPSAPLGASAVRASVPAFLRAAEKRSRAVSIALSMWGLCVRVYTTAR